MTTRGSFEVIWERFGSFPLLWFHHFLSTEEGECSSSLKEMKINYGLINTDSLAELQHWGMSLLGTQHLLHHHSPPSHPKAPPPAGVRVFKVLPPVLGTGQGWEALGWYWGNHGGEVKGKMKFRVEYGMGCDSE